MTSPVDGLTVYVPSTVVSVVNVQFGADSVVPHNANVEEFSVAVPTEVYPLDGDEPAESFVNGLIVTGWAKLAEPVSFVALVAGGGSNVGVIVAFVTWPRESATT